MTTPKTARAPRATFSPLPDQTRAAVTVTPEPVTQADIARVLDLEARKVSRPAVNALPPAVLRDLAFYRENLEIAPSAISNVLKVASYLLNRCAMVADPPAELATQANICSMVDCARLAADCLETRIDALLGVLDDAGGAE